MTSSFRNLIWLSASNLKRCLHTSAIRRSAVVNDGKTTVKFLNKDFSSGFLVNAYSEIGFTLTPGFQIIGPVIILPRTFLSWNIASSSDMNEDNLCLFNILEPSLDVLVIGLDMQYPTHAPFMKDVRQWLQKSNITSEILPVHHAVSTYNFLASEGRFVAAALVPPKGFTSKFNSTVPLPEHERLPMN